MTKEDKEKLLKLLLKEKSALEAELARFTDKNQFIKGDYKTRFPKTAESSDTTERAQDVTEYERGMAIEHNLELRLKEINETIEKIGSGNYGLCSNCQSPIEVARLKAIPAVSTCINCAKNSTLL